MQVTVRLSHEEADALYRLNRRLLDAEIAHALAPCEKQEISFAIDARNRLCVALHAALDTCETGMVNGRFANPKHSE